MSVPSINLDNTVFLGRGVERILNVTLADNTEMPDNLESCAAEHVVLVIRKRLRWCNNNRVTSVCTKRIEVLHIAADDCVLMEMFNFSMHNQTKINSHQRHHEQPRIRVPSSPSCCARSEPEGTD